jgi:hypothetical protein
MKTKKMTLRYWNALSEGSQRRALMHVFPLQKVLIDMLVSEKLTAKDIHWKAIQRIVRIPEDTSVYKTSVSKTFIP